MITVLIPTFNRPSLLRTALASIEKQSGLDYVSKVVVSENGLNDASKEICEEFTTLNIEYVYQHKQLPVLEHLKWLLSKEKTGYVAMLCDDDWWNEYHIELAARNLLIEPSAVAYFSNFVWVDSESRLNFNAYIGTRFFDIENSKKSNAGVLSYNRQELLLTAFIATPFHYSALICKAEVLVKAVTVFDNVHPTYSDRVLWTAIAKFGEVLFNPLATVLVRNHSEQDSHNYSSAEWRIRNQEGSVIIKEIAEAEGINVENKINEFYLNCPDGIRQLLIEEINRIYIDKKSVSWFAGIDIILAREKADKIMQMKALRNSKSRVRLVARYILNTMKKLSE